ncbi:hypothetical protein BGZ94_001797 [Podila epigama]|nr:hypothetical protein BGZ94_001797 [Podila epigama]
MDHNEKSALVGFNFSASSAIAKFMALHQHGRQQRKQQEQPNQNQRKTVACNKRQLPIESTELSAPLKHSQKRTSMLKNDIQSSNNIELKHNNHTHQTRTKQAVLRVSADDNTTLSLTGNIQPTQPGSTRTRLEQHRYIISTHLLQNTELIRALLDPACANVDLVERDFEYLRKMLPESTRNRDTIRVEADLVLDEHNAVIFYPLRLLGQRKSTMRDISHNNPTGGSKRCSSSILFSGLEELAEFIARVGPRYRVLWIILEEYSWTPNPISNCKSLGAMAFQFLPKSTKTTLSISQQVPQQVPQRAPQHAILNINPYVGPVMEGLTVLLSWAATCQERDHWLAMVSTESLTTSSHHHGRARSGVGSNYRQRRFQTQILFASDARSSALVARTIGDKIVAQLEHIVAQGLRHERDGWQNKEEWLWREWLNEQESTHERFLNALQIFNPFSVQLILSLCTLREFLAMDHNKRIDVVGKFVDPEVLAEFQHVISQPMPYA